MFSETFIRRPVLATVCSFVIVLLGAVSIPILPIDYYPEVAPPTVSVTANYQGASAEVVESTVTNILEREINRVQGMRYIRSTSASDGTSNIVVTFEQGRNLDRASIDVQNRVATVESQLPEAVIQTGVTVEKSGGGSFVQVVCMFAPEGDYDTLFMSNYTDLFIRDVLRRIPGISSVQIFGERRYAMRLWLDPVRLTGRGLTVEDVVSAVEDQNIQVAAGAIGQQPAAADQLYQFNVQARGRLQDATEFGDIVLATGSDGSIVRVTDVGRVELGAQDYNSSFQYNGVDAVGIGISKLSTANSVEIAQAVKDTMTELERDFPPGLQFAIPYDTTKFIDRSVREVVLTLLQAIVYVVLVIFIFLQNWRTTLIPAIAIPVSLIGTFAFMVVMDFSINTLTMFGITLATGVVVDDAIVVVENVSTKLERGLSPLQAAIAAMQEIFGAVIATTLVLLAVFIPVAFFPGTTGQIYRQFALTIVFSVCISTFNALTLSPALSALFLAYEEPQNAVFRVANRAISALRRGYERILRVVVGFRRATVVVFVLLLGVTVWMYRAVPTGFLPTEDQGYFINFVQGPPGSSLHFTQGILDEAVEVLQSRPEIDSTVSIGGFSFAGSAPNNGLIFAPLKSWDDRKGRGQSAPEIVNSLRGPLLGGISEGLVIPIDPPPIQGLGTAGGFDFQLQDRSLNDFAALEQTSFALFGASNQRPEIDINPPTFSASTPQLNVTVDRSKAQLLGIEPKDIFDTLQTALGGNYVNDFDVFNRSYRVYVQADAPYRANPSDISQLYVRSQTTDAMIPLATVVDVEEIAGPQIINHYNLFRSAQIQGASSPGYSAGEALQAMEQLAEQLLPQGMGFEWTGISLEQLESGGQSAFLFLLGIVFVFLFLAAQYESYIDPFIIMLSVPLAILGALIFQSLRGLSNDIFCQVGLVLLIGLASKNSILIVEFANQLRQQGLPIAKAAVEAAQSRFRAILMTAFSFILGVLPLVLATGAGAGSRRSLGTTVFGGMLVSTLLSLVVVPVLYIAIKTAEEKWLRRSRRSPQLVGGEMSVVSLDED